MSELALPTTEAKQWPEEIFVEPSRLATGIWGEREGDIAAAYCADTFPKVKTFSHEGQLYVNTGTATKTSNNEEGINGYPLLPADRYAGPEPRRYTYEGRAAEYKRKNYRLGPRIVFASRTRTVEEWIDLLRRQYAHGGYFASGKTYKRVLRNFRQESRRMMPRNERIAIELELRIEDQPATQAEMLSRLNAAQAQPRRVQRPITAQDQLDFRF
jgi:hypothetical protein